jgi:hypothetical protein
MRARPFRCAQILSCYKRISRRCQQSSSAAWSQTAAAAKIAKVLRKKETLLHFAAKDILRAAGLPLLTSDDSEVAADLDKVKAGRRGLRWHCGATG